MKQWFTGLLITTICKCGVIAWFSDPLAAAEFNAVDFGVVADGKTDDGPAILKMLHSARKVVDEPVRMVFPKNKVIFATTADDGYLLSLGHMKNVTVDGNGSTFLLDPAIRMVDLNDTRNTTLKDFNVDYTESMFVETTIQAIDAKKGFIDVKPLEPVQDDHLGGPTEQKGEQWFGGFVWCDNGKHPKAAKHYSVKSIKKLDNNRIRVFTGDKVLSSAMVKAIIPGATRFSMPRAGVAHRHGPGPLFSVHDATDVRLERITVWSAPWFAFSIYRCEGTCEFLDVNVVQKPGTQRLMSGCRDAFHVTANRAKLIFDGCDTRGTGDDDYNFCVLTSAIQEVTSLDTIVIRQKFPIQYNPMRVGETLVVMNSGNSVLGSAKIISYEETPLKNGEAIVPGGNCPQVTITLENPITGLAQGLTAWSKEAANPDTTMTNCTASFSNRMQTSLKIDRCKFTCYNESYGMSDKEQNVEGPGPEFIWITRSEFETGRGAGYVAKSGGAGSLTQTRIQKIHIEDSVFNAPLQITKARSITLLKNRFQDVVKVGEYENLEMRGNTRNGAPFSIDTPRQKQKSYTLSDEHINYLLAGDVAGPIGLKESIEGRKRFGVRGWNKKQQVFNWPLQSSQDGVCQLSLLVKAPVGTVLELKSNQEIKALTVRDPHWCRIPATLKIKNGEDVIQLALKQDLHKGEEAELMSVEVITEKFRPVFDQQIADLKTSRGDCKWFQEAGFGLMFQWGCWGYPKAGDKKSPWPRIYQEFDIEAFADKMKGLNPGYIVWSITWRGSRFSVPLKSVEQIMGSKDYTMEYDFLGRLADALNKRNIPMFLYYHPGAEEPAFWSKMWHGQDHRLPWEDANAAIWTEIGNRLGDKLAGWFIDAGMVQHYPADFHRYKQALQAGNPKRLTTFNPWRFPNVSPYDDMSFGEDKAPGNKENGIFVNGPTEGLMAHAMMILDGPAWGIFKKNTVIKQPRWEVTELQKMVDDAKKEKHPISFNILMYEDGTLGEKTEAVLKQLKR